MKLGELLGHLDQYVNRDDPDYVSNRLHFIQAGHRWLERKFHGREALFAKWDTTTPLLIGSGTVPLPACYRASAELRVALLPERTPLTRIPPAAIRTPWQLADGTVLDFRQQPLPLGTPGYFAVYGRALELRPLTDRTRDVEIQGTGWSEPLLLPDDETVLTQEAPDAVLYAAAREVWLFMGDQPQKDYWEAQAAAAVGEWIQDRIHEETPVTPVMEVPG
jgi:hypothetical protein